ncbi:MAG TPA: 1-deoxy-D-xylulose-5-phosphate synthase N-terminal domain-containing protein, partial [Bacilli bacterium]|nr:1-deoxy-D-xylulose-5-phosphate synthase N-terminal domain-containing protein [Bacilli bacterium]
MINIEQITCPSDIKKMNIKELEQLAGQVRQFIIENVSKTGGHLSANLGVVELSIALHYVFNSPHDKLIFDVGHQTYTHKILTGRSAQF